jgi:predicted enzyme related to lactoylglutathione lyase
MANNGTFMWNELNTHNPEAAKKCYAAALGWSYDEMPMPDGTYWVIKKGEDTVGGIFTMKGPHFDGAPEQWLAYIQVDDVDERVKKLTAAGGKALREPFDIKGVGRIAIVQDNAGACFGLMKPAPQQ